MIPSTTEIKKSIAEQLYLLVDNLHVYRTSCRALSNIGVDIDDDSGSLQWLVTAVFKARLNDFAKALSFQYAKNSPVSIAANHQEIDFLKSEFKHRNVRLEIIEADKKSSDIQKLAIDSVIDVIDFDSIHADFSSQVDSVRDRSMLLHAESLIHTLRMGFDNLSLKTTSRYIGVSRRATSYWYCQEYISEFYAFELALSEVEKETGYQFGTGANGFRCALEGLSSDDEVLPKRCSFGSASRIEIYTYKSKYEIRISRTALDALQAFILIYGNADHQKALELFIEKVNVVRAA